MRWVLTTAFLAFSVAGCTAPVPNDQDQYFDNITPDPTQLDAEHARLREAESSAVSTVQTVQLPDATQQTADVTPIEPVVRENAAISNTQDFKAVKEKETIASDAAKLAALKETYEVVQPEALPQRTESVNLAAYALSQKQALGTRVYSRFNDGGSGCLRYRNNPDDAQRAFLKAGGPEKDRDSLDPDGDGFACNWDPSTYRRLLGNG